MLSSIIHVYDKERDFKWRLRRQQRTKKNEDKIDIADHWIWSDNVCWIEAVA